MPRATKGAPAGPGGIGTNMRSAKDMKQMDKCDRDEAFRGELSTGLGRRGARGLSGRRVCDTWSLCSRVLPLSPSVPPTPALASREVWRVFTTADVGGGPGRGGGGQFGGREQNACPTAYHCSSLPQATAYCSPEGWGGGLGSSA